MHERTQKIWILCIGLAIFLNGFYHISQSHSDLTELNVITEKIPFQKGMSFTTWSNYSYTQDWVHAEFIKMKDIGIEWLAINHWWWQDYLNSTEIKPGPWSDSYENLTACFLYAKSLGLHIMYKPMLNLLKTYDWRSYIVFTPDWMGNYTAWMIEHAKAAQAGGVEILCIGTEMGNMQVHSAEVREMIRQIRLVYTGLITYSANHDSFQHIDWYDALDIIGISMYSMMTVAWDPSATDLAQVWNGMYSDLETLALRWKRPIMFTETGIQATDGSNLIPNDNKISKEKDLSEMQNYYLSLFQSKIWSAAWFKGAYWWIWDQAQADNTNLKDFNPVLVQDIIQTEYQKSHIVVSLDIILLKNLLPLVFILIFCIILYFKSPLQKNSPNAVIQKDQIDPNLHQPSMNFNSDLILGLVLGSFFAVLSSNLQLVIYGILQQSVSYAVILRTSLTEIFISFGIVFIIAFLVGLVCLRSFSPYLVHIGMVLLLVIPYLALSSYWLNVFIFIFLDLVLCFIIGGLLITTKIKVQLGNIRIIIAAALFVLTPFIGLQLLLDSLAQVFLVIPLGFVWLKGSYFKHSIERDFSKKTKHFELQMLITSLLAGMIIPIGNTILNLVQMNLLNISFAYLPAVIGASVLCSVSFILHKRIPNSTKKSPILWFSNQYLALSVIIIALFGFLYVQMNFFIPIWGFFSGLLLILLLGTWITTVDNGFSSSKLGRSYVYLILIGLFYVFGFIFNGIKGLFVYTLTFLVIKDGQILTRDPLIDPVPQFDVPLLLNYIIFGAAILLGIMLGIYWMIRQKFCNNKQKKV